MKRIILGAIMLLSIPALANSVAIADFTVERYADYTYPSVEQWMTKTYWMSPSDLASYCEKDPYYDRPLLLECAYVDTQSGWTFTINNGERQSYSELLDTLDAQDKAKQAGMYECIYSADTANIFRDLAFVFLGIGGIVLIVSSKRKQKIKG